MSVYLLVALGPLRFGALAATLEALEAKLDDYGPAPSRIGRVIGLLRQEAAR
jgi:hypothetical protein